MKNRSSLVSKSVVSKTILERGFIELFFVIIVIFFLGMWYIFHSGTSLNNLDSGDHSRLLKSGYIEKQNLVFDLYKNGKNDKKELFIYSYQPVNIDLANVNIAVYDSGQTGWEKIAESNSVYPNPERSPDALVFYVTKVDGFDQLMLKVTTTDSAGNITGVEQHPINYSGGYLEGL